MTTQIDEKALDESWDEISDEYPTNKQELKRAIETYLTESAKRQPAMEGLRDIRSALQSITEYWNQDRNDTAMHDACWHSINTAEEALAALDKIIAGQPTNERK